MTRFDDVTVTPVGRRGMIFAGLSFNVDNDIVEDVELEDNSVGVDVAIDGADIEEGFSDDGD